MPKCSTCDRDIEGKFVAALGKTYHPEHFLCSSCHQPIKDSFQIRDDAVFCSDCFNKKFAEICAKCKEVIRDTSVQAFGKSYHPNCFLCKECKKPIGLDQYYEIDGKPVCEKCYKNKHAPICAQCKQEIEGEVTTAFDHQYHPECFKCTKCKKPITDDTFIIIGGKPICATCMTVK